jgi:hypothetical protein
MNQTPWMSIKRQIMFYGFYFLTKIFLFMAKDFGSVDQTTEDSSLNVLSVVGFEIQI